MFTVTFKAAFKGVFTAHSPRGTHGLVTGAMAVHSRAVPRPLCAGRTCALPGVLTVAFKDIVAGQPTISTPGGPGARPKRNLTEIKHIKQKENISD